MPLPRPVPETNLKRRGCPLISRETADLIDRYILRLMRGSTPERTAWNMEKIRQGVPADWNYIDGCMMTALLALTDITGDRQYMDFVDHHIDAFVNADGSIRTFDAEKHTLDDINEGRVLIPLFEATGKEKYRLAADTLRRALENQPRTAEGNFWHKQIYPNQVWLDGIYMALPFLALYERAFGRGDYSDILRQADLVRARMRDPKTGLYYHGYDASRTAFWADPETGLSRSFWLRAIGWFSVALTDLIEIIPKEAQGSHLTDLFVPLMRDLLPWADPETGMYYQVVNQRSAPGNYLESSGSAMIAYAMLKGARLGVLEPSFARQGQKTFEGIVNTRMTFEGGEVQLDGICLVAGLGPENNRRRDGTLAYYLSEPVVKNDAKGVAPFLLCYTEIKRLNAL